MKCAFVRYLQNVIIIFYIVSFILILKKNFPQKSSFPTSVYFGRYPFWIRRKLNLHFLGRGSSILYRVARSHDRKGWKSSLNKVYSLSRNFESVSKCSQTAGFESFLPQLSHLSTNCQVPNATKIVILIIIIIWWDYTTLHDESEEDNKMLNIMQLPLNLERICGY